MISNKILSNKHISAIGKLLLIHIAETPSYINYTYTTSQIGKALGITRIQAQKAIHELIQLGLIISTAKQPIRITKLTSKFYTEELC